MRGTLLDWTVVVRSTLVAIRIVEIPQLKKIEKRYDIDGKTSFYHHTD